MKGFKRTLLLVSVLVMVFAATVGYAAERPPLKIGLVLVGGAVGGEIMVSTI